MMNLTNEKISIIILTIASALFIILVLFTILKDYIKRVKELEKQLEEADNRYRYTKKQSELFISSLNTIISKYGSIEDKVNFINYLHKNNMSMNGIETLFDENRIKKNKVPDYRENIMSQNNISLNKEALIPDEELYTDSVK